jgi:hypothetical protein
MYNQWLLLLLLSGIASTFVDLLKPAPHLCDWPVSVVSLQRFHPGWSLKKSPPGITDGEKIPQLAPGLRLPRRWMNETASGRP